MNEIKLGLGPNVLIWSAAGAVLGLIFGIRIGADPGITAASMIVLTVLSGIFGMFAYQRHCREKLPQRRVNRRQWPRTVRRPF